MRLLRRKNVIDERERMEMYRIEHFMFWVVFFALIVSIMVQMIFMRAPFSQVAGEWIVFLIMALGTLVKELHGGYYDYISRPGWKSYLAYSIGGAVLCGFLVIANGIMRGYYRGAADIMLVFLIVAGFMFVVLYAALAVTGAAVKRRRRKLEEEYGDE